MMSSGRSSGVSEFEDWLRERVGQRVGKYTLERLLGAGGMAAVYEGVHRNGHRVAVKMLHPHVAIMGDVQERFLREGYLANRVRHRGAVRVIDDDVTADGAVFLVMEILSGTTVDALWVKHSQRLPLAQAVEVGRQLLEILAVAHDCGIVHRDIKPENLFLTDEGEVKVLDFGIARLLEADGKRKTATGRMMGTPAFMPPEQALGRAREIDGRSDLWSAGATLFTLLSGEFVHRAETAEEMLVRAGSKPARSLATVAPEIHAPVAEVIDRALAFDKGDRWGDARAMLSALEASYSLAERDPRTQSSHEARAAIAATVSAVVAHARVAPTVDDPELSRPRVARTVPFSRTATADGASRLPAFDEEELVTELAVPAWVPPRGVTTTAGMTSHAPRPAPAPRTPRRIAVVAAGLIAVAALASGLGVVALRVDGEAAAGAPPISMSLADPGSPPAREAEGAAAPTESTRRPSSAGAAATAASARDASTAETRPRTALPPVVSPVVAPRATADRTSASPAALAAPGPAAVPAPSVTSIAPVAGPPPDCATRPTYPDPKGGERLRPECFQTR